MPFDLTILGCNSAVPTNQRKPTAQLLNVAGRFFLIDCGEGTQLQLRKYKIRMQNIHHVFISHLHGDHYFGLIGFISTMHLLGREKELHVYGPAELKEIIYIQLEASKTTLCFPLFFHEFGFENPELLMENNDAIGEFLELEPIKKDIKQANQLVKDSKIDNDFEYAASNRVKILQKWQSRYDSKSEPKKSDSKTTKKIESVVNAQKSKTLSINLNPKSDSNVSGVVLFTETNGMVKMNAKVSGLSDGFHAIHIHQTSDCSSVDGKDFGKLNTVGKPQKGVELKIEEETGEILMRGPFVMVGYYKNEELSNQTLRGGWLHTGDKGFLDDDGYLHITGRVADSFKTSKGEYIEPLTLEQYFVNINEIEEVCVVGLGIAQPLCLIQLSEIGKKASKDALSKMLTETLDTVNNGLVNYKKISTLIVVKDEWTQENGVIGPTQKLKRGAVEDLYSGSYLKWHESNEKLIFESSSNHSERFDSYS